MRVMQNSLLPKTRTSTRPLSLLDKQAGNILFRILFGPQERRTTEEPALLILGGDTLVGHPETIKTVVDALAMKTDLMSVWKQPWLQKYAPDRPFFRFPASS